MIHSSRFHICTSTHQDFTSMHHPLIKISNRCFPLIKISHLCIHSSFSRKVVGRQNYHRTTQTLSVTNGHNTFQTLSTSQSVILVYFVANCYFAIFFGEIFLLEKRLFGAVYKICLISAFPAKIRHFDEIKNITKIYKTLLLEIPNFIIGNTVNNLSLGGLICSVSARGFPIQ